MAQATCAALSGTTTATAKGPGGAPAPAPKPGPPGGKPSKVSSDLASQTTSYMRVVIQWTQPTGCVTKNDVANYGGTVVNEFTAVNAGLYVLPSSSLSELASDPLVVYASPDRPVSSKLDNTAAAMKLSSAWSSKYKGTNVGVAVIDSGMNPDPNLTVQSGPSAPRIVYTQDFVTLTPPGPGQPPLGADLYGHGQHIAGIIAANGATSNCLTCTRTFLGMAPEANLIDLRVLDQNGQGMDSDIILALDTAIQLKETYNIRVINLSLGRPVFESYRLDPLCQAVEAAWKAGIVVVVSAGNDGRDNSHGNEGYGTISAPANDPFVITVGSMKTEGTPTRTDDLIASYSSKGPTQVDHIVKPDVVAPGNLVVSLLVKGSTLQTENPGNGVAVSYYQTLTGPAAHQPQTPQAGTTQNVAYSPHYFVLSGTSMAAGAVSGVVADLISAKSTLTPDQIKAILM